MHVADQTWRVLQLRLIDVQVHPVDAFHLEPDMLGPDIGNTSRYGHHGLRFGDQAATTANHGHRAVIYPSGPAVTGHPARPEPPATSRESHTPRRAGAKPRKWCVSGLVDIS